MESDVERVLGVLDQLGVEYKRETDGRAKICCPFHDEKTPSMTIYDDNSCFCFGCHKFCWHDELISKIANCNMIEAKKKLGTFDPNVNYGSGEKWGDKFKLPNMELADPTIDLTDRYERLSKDVPPQMEKYLESKGLLGCAYELGGWRWHERGTFKFWEKQDGICIPYFGPKGEITTFRLRRYDKMREKFGHPLAPKGLSLQASYMVIDHSKPVYFCEGETDSLSLRSLGKNVICFPGVGAKKQLHSAILQCFDWEIPKLIFCGDNDEAGQGFNKYAIDATMTLGLGKFCPQLRTLPLPDEYNILPDGRYKRKDINDFLVEGRLKKIIRDFEVSEGDAETEEDELIRRMREIFGDVEELPESEVEGIF